MSLMRISLNKMHMKRLQQTFSPFDQRAPMKPRSKISAHAIASKVLKLRQNKQPSDKYFSTNLKLRSNFSPQFEKRVKVVTNENLSQLSPNLQTIKRFWDPGLIHDSEQRQQRLLNDIKSVENILQYEMYSNITKSRLRKFKESGKDYKFTGKLVHSPVQTIRTKLHKGVTNDSDISCFGVEKSQFHGRLLSPVVKARLIL